jgi:hypothetical protein
VTALSWILLVAALLVLLTVAVHSSLRARRLDRLHVRTDAAHAALHAALDRRAAVALRVARALGSPGGAGAAEGVAAAAAAARTTPAGQDGDCESAENRLGHHLATIDRARLPDELHADLVDAEQLVILARRVYNDAVRDTLELRSRRLVRWLRLAGTAPVPAYFEIADPEPGRPDPTEVAR